MKKKTKQNMSLGKEEKSIQEKNGVQKALP